MEDCEPVKLLLIGDGTVGKSQLLIRYLASRFDPNFIVTIGVQCHHATVPHDGNLAKVQIWDAAGQEKFRTISPAYYAKAHGVMIVYDITNHSSFRSVEYWKQQVDTHTGDDGADVPIIVVGNKTDLVDEHTMSLRVSMDEEESLSDKLGVPFRPASAKKGNGVHEAFGELIDLAVQRHFGHNGRCFLKPTSVRTSALTRGHNSMVQRCRRQSLRLSQCSFPRSSMLSTQPVPKPQSSAGSISNHTRLRTEHGQGLALASSGKDSSPRVEPVTTRSATGSAVCSDAGEAGIETDDRLIKIMPCPTVCSHPPAQIVRLPRAQAHAAQKTGAHLMPDGNHFLASQASGQSDTEAGAFSLGRVGIPDLGIYEEVDNMEFDSDGGQSPLPLAKAECGMAGIVTSSWVICMNECCQYDGQSDRILR